MKYSEELKSPKWQRKRLEVLNRDNFKCCLCGDTETELHVHHLKYNGKPYESDLDDLETLCWVCHYYKTFFFNQYFNDFQIESSLFVGVKKGSKTFFSIYKNEFAIYRIEHEKKIISYVCTFAKENDSIKLLNEIINNL